MNALYDVVCSMVIGGIVLTMILGFNGNIVESAGVQTVRVMAQSNLTAVTSILEYDFRKMGYHVGNNPDSSIIYADSNKIKFIGDFTDKAKIDTIIYSFDPNAPSGKPNRNTHILTRTYIPKSLSGSSVSINLGMTRFRLWYYNNNDSSRTLPLTANPIASPLRITEVKVAIGVESVEPYKETTMPYLKLNPGGYWERTFKPKNLR